MNPRSYLYVPGDRPQMLAKAITRGADALIVDLEDGVAPSRKDKAREDVRSWLAGLPLPERGPEIWLRINNVGASLDAEFALLTAGPVFGLILPKTESPAQVERLISALPKPASIIPLIETAGGIVSVDAIARVPGVIRLAMGEADLKADLGMRPSTSHDDLHPLRMQVIVASAAATLPRPIGSVSTDFTDPERLRQTSLDLRRIGFGARSCIHPSQVRISNEVFAPDPEEIAEARRIIELAEAAAKTGSGVFVGDDGHMVDEAVVRSARRVLEDADGAAT